MAIVIDKISSCLLLSALVGITVVAATNECSLSLKNHLLTCENVVWQPQSQSHQQEEQEQQPAAIETHLTNDSYVLILKNSKDLHLRPEFHTDAFKTLNSYQVVNVRTLRIAPETFAFLTRLEYVKICDNDYPKIVANTFKGLLHLKTLNLNNNSLHEVESGAFNGLTALETLELTHNDFRIVRKDMFAELVNLKSLFLYHNNIEVLEDGCLTGLDSLNVLDLTYNRIAKIGTQLFNGLSISQLYLSYNHIETIDGDFELANLEFLYLQNNKLKSISDSIFSLLGALQDVDISRNRIAEMSPLAFYNCTKLMNLNYKENNLKAPVEFEFASNSTNPFITS